jgi:ABC-2 type transport system permease protein
VSEKLCWEETMAAVLPITTTEGPSLSRRSLAHSLTIYVQEARYEFLKYLRLPIYSMSTILFPLMFYVLFGLLMNPHGTVGSLGVRTYLIATYGTFGVMGASLFANGAGVATERGLGWMQVKRASPMPPFAYFVAKFAVSMIFGGIVLTLLLLLGTVFGGVRIPLADAATLGAILVIGAIPFSALGLVIGLSVGPNSAPAIVNMIYLPLSFASGLWFPIEALPKFLQKLAVFLPPYHLAQIALGVVGLSNHKASSTHWQYLFGFTLVALGLAWVLFRRDEGKMYG